MRVVVVDDHPVFRKGLVALLSADGIDVVGEAENGLEAIAVVAETSPDVVLMDLGMPELGGIEATERIVAADPGQSGDRDNALRRRAVGAGRARRGRIRIRRQAGSARRDRRRGPRNGGRRDVDRCWRAAPGLRHGRRQPAARDQRPDAPRECDRRPAQSRSVQSGDRRATAPVGQNGRELRLDHPAQGRRRGSHDGGGRFCAIVV